MWKGGGQRPPVLGVQCKKYRFRLREIIHSMTRFDLSTVFDEFTKRQDSLLNRFRTLESSAYLCGIYVLYISNQNQIIHILLI